MPNRTEHPEQRAVELGNPLQPTNLDEAMRMASALHTSRLLPADVHTPEVAFAIIVTGRELGISAMQALRSIRFERGKPILSADLLLLLVRRAPTCEEFRLVESTDKRAVYRAKRFGEDATTLDATLAEVARAGLLGHDSWRRFPKAMLRARCIATLARAVFPEVALGVYEPHELAEPSSIASAPERGAPSPELEAASLLERIESARLLGDLNEAWSDFDAAKARLAPRHVEVIKSAKDARKAVLSQVVS